jgi:uncharacterized protein
MVPTRTAVLALLAAIALSPLPAQAASIDCRARDLTGTEVAICEDQQLSRLDVQIARKADTAARRMNFGQYLGLRFWQARLAEQRNQCEGDRGCITSHFRVQARLLDRLQQCLDTRIARRACLRDTISVDREAARAAGSRRGTAAPR